MSIVLPQLPFEKNALEPYIRSQTLEYHYGKHHSAYVTNTNNFIAGTPLENESLENIIRLTSGDPKKIALFNNAAQVWNHTFYWHSLSPNGGSLPRGAIAAYIDRDFGSYADFSKALKEMASGLFGSGWIWLVVENGKLSLQKTSNADTPIAHGVKPLLCIDVWEHAYYLDYKNARADYVNSLIDHLINWDFANKNLEE